MNKKKAVYTSLTALALASFSATTFADEVAETAVAETTVALADEAVAEDTVVEASPEVAATETVADEEPVAVTALAEDTAVTANAEQREAINAGDFTSLTGTWETADGTALSVNENGLLSTVANPTPFEPKLSDGGLMVLLTGENSKDIYNDSVGYNYVATEDMIIYYPPGSPGRTYVDYNSKQDFNEVHAGSTYRKVSDLPTTYKVTDLSAYTNFEVAVNGNIGDQTIAEYWNSLPTDDVRKTNKQIDILTLYLDSGEKVELVLDPSRDSLDNLVETLDLTGWGGASSSFSIGENEYGTLFYRHYKVGNLPEVVEENELNFETVEIRSQVEAGDFSYFVGTWKNDSGEVVSVSADGTISSALYATGFRQALSADSGRVGLVGETTASGTVLDKDVLNFGLNKYSGIQKLGSAAGEGFTGETFWTKVSDEETPYEVVDWSWTGLKRFEESIIGQGDEQTWADLASQQEYLVTFFGTYNNQDFSLTSTIDKSGVWSILDSFNLAEDDILSSGGGLYGSGYFYLKDGVVPTLKKDAVETVTLTDKNGSEVSVDLLDNEGVANLEVIDHIEPSQVNPAPIARLEGLDYDLYDITLKDAQGNPITTLKAAAIVKLPVDEGKIVERVIYLPENGDAETLAILKQENGFVYFETNHFSHYGVVYALVTSPEEATKDVATTRNELLLTLDASGLTDAQKSDFAEKIAFAETAEELADLQAEFDALLQAGAGQVVQAVVTTPKADSKPTQPLSRIARAQEEKAAKSGKTLPQTGEKTSLIGLVGLGLLALGAVGQKRRNI